MNTDTPHGSEMLRAALDETAAAEYVGLKAQTLRKWRGRARGPVFYRVGVAIRYRVSDLNRWLESCRCDPAQKAKRKGRR